MKTTKIQYATVILPLAVPKEYAYIIPESMSEQIAFGIRVEVPVRNKLYSAIVIALHEDLEIPYKARRIRSIIDTNPIIDQKQYKLWKWLASYYACTIGEVMSVALPSGLKLSSETKIHLNPDFDINQSRLDDDTYMIVEALSIQGQLTIEEIRSILDKKTVYPVIRSLLDDECIFVTENLKTKYKPKVISVVSLNEYIKAGDQINEALEKLSKSEKQTKAFLAIYQLSKKQDTIPSTEVYKMSDTNSSVLKALEKKGLISSSKIEISRLLYQNVDATEEIKPLSEDQQRALFEIEEKFLTQDQILLHGVTGSGKTRLYIELIQKQLELGKQVLYLLPEIALTTQIVSRLQAVFGNLVGSYHSKMNNNQRVEIWKSVLDEKPIILGARSSLFLPFKNLGLIIIDEEHDPSYKQNDPNPRYNGRDTAIVLAKLFGAKVLLGTATPSIETYGNVHQGKYGLVEMKERFGAVELPEIEVVDLKYQYKTGQMKSHFSAPLVKIMTEVLDRGEQVMIFQNRRGYSPTIQCSMCGWHAECDHCDISLTVHKFFQELRCHYCGIRKKLVEHCPACGHDQLTQLGFGTEKIESEIKVLFPDVKVARMDFDTTKTRLAYETVISDFMQKKTDVLVGTQMITKGLDFDHVGVVGILNADLALQFPDFRATERAYQLFTQVSGRAGRKHRQGRVILQSFQPTHPVILETIDNNFPKFYAREMHERRQFQYPPILRLINITLKHKNAKTVSEAAFYLAKLLKKKLANRVVGPAQPGVARLRGQYLQQIFIKMEKNAKQIAIIKAYLLSAKSQTQKTPGLKSVRINIDVDPY